MFPPNLITPGSLESQEEEMGTFRVQMIQRVLDIFFPLLPKHEQIITTSTCLILSGISSLSKTPGESQQGDPDQLVEIIES